LGEKKKRGDLGGNPFARDGEEVLSRRNFPFNAKRRGSQRRTKEEGGRLINISRLKEGIRKGEKES